MALKHRTPPALNEHRDLYQFGRLGFKSILGPWKTCWIRFWDLGVKFRASRNRLCPNFRALQFKIGPLRVNFVLSGLNFGPLRVDFWRWGLDFGPLELNFLSILASWIQFQTSWIRF